MRKRDIIALMVNCVLPSCTSWDNIFIQSAALHVRGNDGCQNILQGHLHGIVNPGYHEQGT